jgi:hypothetical protein
MDLGKAEGLEGIDELTELADVGERLCMPRPHQRLAAFGLEKAWVPHFALTHCCFVRVIR